MIPSGDDSRFGSGDRSCPSSHSSQSYVQPDKLRVILIMIGASRRELRQLHAEQLPALGIKSSEFLSPLKQAEALLSSVEKMVLQLGLSSFPTFVPPFGD